MHLKITGMPSKCVICSTPWMWPCAFVYFLLPGATRGNTFSYTSYLFASMCSGSGEGDAHVCQGSTQTQEDSWKSAFSCDIGPGFELRSSGLLASAFLPWAILLAQEEIFIKSSARHDLSPQNLLEMWVLGNNLWIFRFLKESLVLRTEISFFSLVLWLTFSIKSNIVNL